MPTSEQYADRRARGLCVECRERAEPGSAYCPRHKEAHRRQKAGARRSAGIGPLFHKGEQVRLGSWDYWNGTEPRYEELPPPGSHGRVVAVPTGSKDTYTVDFPGYGELQVMVGEMVDGR